MVARISARRGSTVPPVRRAASGTAIAHIDGMGAFTVEETSRLHVVPELEWHLFLKRFSWRHRGWLATIHGIEQNEPVTCVPSARLESVALEGAGPRALVRLTIANGVSLCVPRPHRVRVQQTDDGAERALEVDSADGAVVRLAFRATALPEQLDGVAPGELHAHPQ
jgi:hypothetical protein